jgi:hypothetical protein
LRDFSGGDSLGAAGYRTNLMESSDRQRNKAVGCSSDSSQTPGFVMGFTRRLSWLGLEYQYYRPLTADRL